MSFVNQVGSNIQLGIIALGATQATAQALSANNYFNQVGTCTAVANGVFLPVPQNNAIYKIKNDGVYNLSVYPFYAAAGYVTTINGLAEHIPVLVAPNSVISIIGTSIGQSKTFAGGNAPVVDGNVTIKYQVVEYSGVAPVKDIIFAAAPANAYTVPKGESGYIYSISASIAGDKTITLPAPTTPSLKYTFIVNTAGIVTAPVKITSTGANCAGLLALSDNAGVVLYKGQTPFTTATLVAGGLNAGVVIGDYIEYISDGANWLINCSSAGQVALGAQVLLS